MQLQQLDTDKKYLVIAELKDGYTKGDDNMEEIMSGALKDLGLSEENFRIVPQAGYNMHFVEVIENGAPNK